MGKKTVKRPVARPRKRPLESDGQALADNRELENIIIIIIIIMNFTAISQEMMLVMEIREMLRVANWADSIQPISGVTV